MKKRIVLVGIVLLLILAMSTTVSAKVVRTPFTSTGTVVEIIDPGVWTFPGGNQHFRGMVELMRTDSDDDRITGWHTLVVSGNWDADGYGPLRGTYVLDVDAYDGYWEGAFWGKMSETGMSLKMRGHGYGELSGYRIEGTVLNSVTEGFIIELPGK